MKTAKFERKLILLSLKVTNRALFSMYGLRSIVSRSKKSTVDVKREKD